MMRINLIIMDVDDLIGLNLQGGRMKVNVGEIKTSASGIGKAVK